MASDSHTDHDISNKNLQATKRSAGSKKRNVTLTKTQQTETNNVEKTTYSTKQVKSLGSSENEVVRKDDKEVEVPEDKGSSSPTDISAREMTKVKHNTGRVRVSHASVQVNMVGNEAFDSLQVCLDLDRNRRTIQSGQAVSVVTERMVPSESSLTELVTSELERQKLAEVYQGSDIPFLSDISGREKSASPSSTVHHLTTTSGSVLGTSTVSEERGTPIGSDCKCTKEAQSENDLGCTSKKSYPLRNSNATLVEADLPKFRSRKRVKLQNHVEQFDLKRKSGDDIENPNAAKQRKEEKLISDTDESKEISEGPQPAKEVSSQKSLLETKINCGKASSLIPIDMSPCSKSLVTMFQKNLEENCAEPKEKSCFSNESYTQVLDEIAEKRTQLGLGTNCTMKVACTRSASKSQTLTPLLPKLRFSDSECEGMMSHQKANTTDYESEPKSLSSTGDDSEASVPEQKTRDETRLEKRSDSTKKACSRRRKTRRRGTRNRKTDFNVTKLSEQLDNQLTFLQNNNSPPLEVETDVSSARSVTQSEDVVTETPNCLDSQVTSDKKLQEAVGEESNDCMMDMMNDMLELSPVVPPCPDVDIYTEMCQALGGERSDEGDDLNQDPSLGYPDQEKEESFSIEISLCDVQKTPPEVQEICDKYENESEALSCPDRTVKNFDDDSVFSSKDDDDSGLCLLGDDAGHHKGDDQEQSKPVLVAYSSSSDDEQTENLSESRTGHINSNGRKREGSKESQVRGKSGWEQSLRQKPSKTQLFQVGWCETSSGSSGRTKGDQTPSPSSNGKNCPQTTSVNCDSENRPGKTRSSPRKNMSEADTVAVGVKTSGKKGEGKAAAISPTKKLAECSGISPPKKRNENSPKSKLPDAVVVENDEELEQVVDVEPNLGKLVWARLCGERWWPGLVIKGTLIYLQSEKTSSSWIYWFGDHKVSQVAHDKILPFSENYTSKIGSIKSKIYRKAVLEALVECCKRSGTKVDSDNDRLLLQWAESGFPSNKPGQQACLDPDPDNPLPESVKGYLTEIGMDIRRKAANLDFRKEDLDTAKENAVTAVRKGDKELQDVCIACSDLSHEVKMEHPLFKGGLCAECQNELTETMYAVGDDGLHSFCAVCGAGGDLFVCDTPECKRVYCRPCVEELGGEAVLNKVISASKWQCFICSPCSDQSDCLLQPRTDWQERIIMFFDTGYRVQVPSLDYFEMKRPLRVLSLFDGIGSGKLALDQLGLKVEVYYASEVEQDALVVTKCNHGNTVTQVGDVAKLEYKQLTEMAPIDLLIGGSPCNDLSLANPGRKGFESGSTALLAFEFVRIRDSLQKLNGDTHLFWLYENVASMKTEFKNTLSRFMNCQPALWDSKYMSAQRRGRYFWGNIPGLYSTPAISTHMHENVNLNSVLEQNCNRRAVIDKMGCVTTRSNSLKHGKNDELFPVEMEGEATGIWISEVERLFGYPSHYTDVGNLPVSRRHKLLGKSWSIPIVKQIFAPLKRYFASEDTQ